MRCCGLVPGGLSKEITAAQAERLIEQAKPSGVGVRAAQDARQRRCEGVRVAGRDEDAGYLQRESSPLGSPAGSGDTRSGDEASGAD